MCKVSESKRSGINAFEIEVFLFEFRTGMLTRGADVASFGTEKEVKDKLGTVDL